MERGNNPYPIRHLFIGFWPCRISGLFARTRFFLKYKPLERESLTEGALLSAYPRRAAKNGRLFE